MAFVIKLYTETKRIKWSRYYAVRPYYGFYPSVPELDVDWIHPWIGLGWIGLDWVEILEKNDGLDWVKSLMYQNFYSHFCSPNHLPVFHIALRWGIRAGLVV